MCSVSGMSSKGILKNAKEYPWLKQRVHGAQSNKLSLCVILVIIAYCCAQEYLAMYLWA